MALPASDVFTAADSTPLATHSASWTIARNNFAITNNQARGTTGSDDCYAYWNADVFSADHYSRVSIFGMSNGAQYRGATVRNSGTAGTHACYTFYTDGLSGSGHSEIAKVVAGASVGVLKAIATTFADGDVIELRATGTTTTTISIYKNSVLIDSVTDSSSPLANGAAGITVYGAGQGLDDWQGGNVGGGGGGDPHRIARIVQIYRRQRRG
jgi:hypothetical protein